MPGYAEASTCACANTVEHVFFRDVQIWWCSQCGSWRRPFEGRWRVPIDQSQSVAQYARFVRVDDGDDPPTVPKQDEIPTRPDTGSTKRARLEDEDKNA